MYLIYVTFRLSGVTLFQQLFKFLSHILRTFDSFFQLMKYSECTINILQIFYMLAAEHRCTAAEIDLYMNVVHVV